VQSRVAPATATAFSSAWHSSDSPAAAAERGKRTPWLLGFKRARREAGSGAGRRGRRGWDELSVGDVERTRVLHSGVLACKRGDKVAQFAAGCAALQEWQARLLAPFGAEWGRARTCWRGGAEQVRCMGGRQRPREGEE
jgi:hypothetical protein